MPRTGRRDRSRVAIVLERVNDLKRLLILLWVPMLCSCTNLAYLQYVPIPFNFSELEAGKAYRSAQPSGEELANMIDVLGIRTVVNLRGPNPGEDWYDTEASICQEMGVTLVDHRMSAGSLPEPELLEQIVETLLTAEYPILIHCKGGADRSGAVAAIYRMLIMGYDKADALGELSSVFFHFRASTPCMDALAEMYEPTEEWLARYAEEFDQLTCDPDWLCDRLGPFFGSTEASELGR